MKHKTLVLFDFDGTLTRADSLFRFLIFAMPWHQLILGALKIKLKFIALLLSGRWSNESAKAILFSVFFKGQRKEDLEQLGYAFCAQKLPGILNAQMIDRLRNYKVNGATVALVSASPDLWLSPFCQAEGLEMICTRLQYADGVFTGNFATPNCNYEEKATRTKAVFQLDDFEKIIAYGNSSGDTAMFRLADEAWMLSGRELWKVQVK